MDTLGHLLRDLVRLGWAHLASDHLYAEYTGSQWLPPSALRSLQMAKLRRLVWHCFLHVPFYRERIRLRPDEIDSLHDLGRLPIATLADRGDPSPFSADPSETTTGAEEVRARREAIRRRSRAWGGAPARFFEVAGHGVVAAPCRASGGALHVHADHLIVEVGEGGRLLLTDLHERIAPALRVEVAAHGALEAAGCPCGRSLPLLRLAG